jgi:hypothetical protein
MQHLYSHNIHAMPPVASTVIRCVAVAAWLASVSGCAISQPAGLPLPPERSEPHEALAFYEGTWTLLDKKREGYQETCSWLDDRRRQIVCRTRLQTDSGLREALGVYSYDQTSREYLYHGFGGSGSLMTERGQRIPKGFRFTSEQGTGAEKVRKRFTIEEAAQGRVNTVSETSRAEGPWVIEEKLEYLRTRP